MNRGFTIVEILIAAGLAVLIIGGGVFVTDRYALTRITDYNSCTDAWGSVIMESYPEQCRARDGATFTRVLTPEEEDRLNPPAPTASGDTEDGTIQAVPVPGSEDVPEMIVNGGADDSPGDVEEDLPENDGEEPPVEDVVIECTPEQRQGAACIQVYQPVCANVTVVCITTPCPPVQETMSNSCIACMNPNVQSYTEGACTE